MIDILILVTVVLSCLSYAIGSFLQIFPEHDRGIHFIVLSITFNIAALVFSIMGNAWSVAAWIVMGIILSLWNVRKYERENMVKVVRMDDIHR